MNINIKDNPFISISFENIWKKFFQKNKVIIDNKHFINIQLIKNKYLPYYFNVGKNFTNGICYKININNIDLLKNKTILIYDIPNYFSISETSLDKRIKVKKIEQYEGVLTNLESYSGIEDLLQINFKAKKRAELKKFKKRLELCYDIKYFFYCGEINRIEYEDLFNSFYSLLTKRYNTKGVSNRNLNMDIKLYYYNLIYSLLLERKALFFVIKANGKPISLSLSFLSKDVLFYAIPVFDIDFSKFNLGHTSIMVLFDWCMKNNIKIFDFSKGDGDYKDKWINYSYKFENHIIYDSKNIVSTFTANSLFYFFKTKQKLRDIRINKMLQKLSFKMKNKQTEIFKYKPTNSTYKDTEFIELKKYGFENTSLNIALNEFLYINLANYNDTSIYKHTSNKNLFKIRFKSKEQTIIVS